MKQQIFGRKSLSLVLALTALAAHGAESLTLDEAIRTALAGNPELHAGAGRTNAAAARARQAGLWTNPELTLATEDWAARSGGFADAKQLVGVAQVVPYPGKKRLDRQMGAAGVRRSEAELALRRLELVRDVKAAFYQALAAERLVAVAEDLLKVAESSAATARKRVAAGAAADQEQLRAEIPLEQSKAEMAGYQREWITARQTLALLLGQPEAWERPLAGKLAETAIPALLAPGPVPALAAHPRAVAARIAREHAELELRRARLEPYPDVRLELAGGREGVSDSGIVQLGVSFPLPLLDRAKGRQQEARANAAIAEAEAVVASQHLGHAWAAATQRLRVASEQAAAYRERILPKTQDALRLVQMGFEQGKFGFMDLLDTQRTAAEAQLAYQQKLLALNLAQAELEALQGSLSATPILPDPQN
jgi:cobalt-zinc-cadmium efflux system outer membrane protein